MPARGPLPEARYLLKVRSAEWGHPARTGRAAGRPRLGSPLGTRSSLRIFIQRSGRGPRPAASSSAQHSFRHALGCFLEGGGAGLKLSEGGGLAAPRGDERAALLAQPRAHALDHGAVAV